MKRDKIENIILNISKILSIVTIIAAIVLIIIYHKYITVDNIIKITTERTFHAICVLLLMYICKSLVIFFPVMVLFAASGVVFPLWLALIVNYIGIFLGNSMQYYAGKFAGKSMVDHLEGKYPKIKDISAFSEDNGWFLTFILRLIGFLPADVVSLFLGAMKVEYKKFTLASMLGMTPIMIASTVVGKKITDPFSPEFISACAFTLLISVISILSFRRKKKRKDNQLQD